jgi:hypothetical protein
VVFIIGTRGGRPEPSLTEHARNRASSATCPIDSVTVTSRCRHRWQHDPRSRGRCRAVRYHRGAHFESPQADASSRGSRFWDPQEDEGGGAGEELEGLEQQIGRAVVPRPRQLDERIGRMNALFGLGQS